MTHGMRWVGLDAAGVAVRAGFDASEAAERLPIVMGLDQHRAQITAEWIDLSTGEIRAAGSRRRTEPRSGAS